MSGSSEPPVIPPPGVQHQILSISRATLPMAKHSTYESTGAYCIQTTTVSFLDGWMEALVAVDVLVCDVCVELGLTLGVFLSQPPFYLSSWGLSLMADHFC